MNFPKSTIADEWAQAFEVWLHEPGSTFDHDSMAEWFEAAFAAAGQAPARPQNDVVVPVNDAVPLQNDGVWVSYRSRTISDQLHPVIVDTELIVTDVTPHPSELDALRQAVGENGQAQFLAWGQGVEP